jgi:transposase
MLVNQAAREWRRCRAWELQQQGWSQRRIAAALGVTEGAVSQWMRRAREGGGPQALQHRPPPGSRPKLSAEQRAQIPALLQRGAEAYGFVGQVWTAPRVAVVLKRCLGVRYHPGHLRRLLRRWGWSPQKPARRASQRAEAAIRAWTTERWPALLAKPSTRGAPSSG